MAYPKRTHCIHGHAFDEANTYVPKPGVRTCRRCVYLRKRATDIANRAEGIPQKRYGKMLDREYVREYDRQRRSSVEYKSHRNTGRRVRYRTDEAYRVAQKESASQTFLASPQPYRERAHRACDDMLDPYVIRLLTRELGGKPAADALKQADNYWLIELYRAKLKLKRLIRWPQNGK